MLHSMLKIRKSNFINFKNINFLKILYFVLLLFITNNTFAISSNKMYDDWMNAKDSQTDFRFIMNEPFNSSHLAKHQMVYFKPFIGSNRAIGFGNYDLNEKWKGFRCVELPTLFYRSKNIIYYPKIGEYLRLYGKKERINYSKSTTLCDGVKYSKYYLSITFQPINESNRNLKPIHLTLKSDEIDSSSNEDISEINWYEKFGVNCSFDYLSSDFKCYNELDTHDYERFFFMGDQDDKNEVWKKMTRTQEYETKMNLTTISKYKLDETNPNKNSFENLFISMIEDNAKQTNNDKVLIIVPKKQVKLFIKTIKKIPDNKLNNIKGYVWFEPEERNFDDERKYKPKKYDVLPNDKYDSELSRISNGNLKAKYGRYLTKERYSEDYVAPSIYDNNYNDKPEW